LLGGGRVERTAIHLFYENEGTPASERMCKVGNSDLVNYSFDTISTLPDKEKCCSFDPPRENVKKSYTNPMLMVKYGVSEVNGFN